MDIILLMLLCVCILFSLYWRKKAEEYRELAKVFKLEYDTISRENAVLKRRLNRFEDKIFDAKLEIKEIKRGLKSK